MGFELSVILFTVMPYINMTLSLYVRVRNKTAAWNLKTWAQTVRKFVFLCLWCAVNCVLVVNGLPSGSLGKRKVTSLSGRRSGGMIKNAMCRDALLSLITACSFHYEVKKQKTCKFLIRSDKRTMSKSSLFSFCSFFLFISLFFWPSSSKFPLALISVYFNGSS